MEEEEEKKTYIWSGGKKRRFRPIQPREQNERDRRKGGEVQRGRRVEREIYI